MEITEVKVFPVREEKLKAFVSVVFDHCFMVNDIKVIHGREGLFISMPSRRKKNGDFKDVAHPLNNDTRRLIEERILDEYEQILQVDKGASAEDPASRTEDSSKPVVEKPATKEKTLAEVEELHLRDSFWSVP
ncbi:MAG: septation regulator SpoVG [Deltaproteobacteria bacterium]|nr:septation regulator SpoVG [Deltaproteobacteria bacterium]